MNRFSGYGDTWLKIFMSASLIFLLAATLYIGSKVFLPAIGAVDFKYFWLAGDLWQDGINPYGPDFNERGREVFTRGFVPPQWAYPPHFRPISELMALAPFETAAVIWRALFVLAIAGGIFALFVALPKADRPPLYIMLAGLAFTLSLSATAITIAIGQSSALIFLGYCLFVFGYLKENRWSLGIALILMMIKPTYGFIPAFFLLAHFRHFRVIAVSAVITIGLSVWGLWGFDLQETFAGLGEAFAKYKGSRLNSAQEMTGLRHIVYVVSGADTSQLAYVAIGIALAFGIGRFMSANELREHDRLRVVVLLGLVLLVFAPLHSYDGYFVLAVVIPALVLSRAELLICIPLLLITWRSNNLANITGLKLEEARTFTGSTLESFTAAVTLVLFYVALTRTTSIRFGTRRDA